MSQAIISSTGRNPKNFGRGNVVRGNMSQTSTNEPVFTVGDTDLLAAISLDGTFASATGWSIGGNDGASGTVQAAGTGKSGGASKAVRLVWPSNTAPTQPQAYLGTGQWSPATHMITTFWFKLVSGNITDSADHSGIKWVLFHRNPDDGNATDGRITWGLNSLNLLCSSVASGASDGGLQFSACDQQAGTGIIQNVTRSIGWGTVSTPRTTNVADGSWHRATYEADTIANVMRIWMDGILVLDSTGFTPSMPNAGFKQSNWGDVLVGNSGGFTIDYSEISVWSRP